MWNAYTYSSSLPGRDIKVSEIEADTLVVDSIQVGGDLEITGDLTVDGSTNLATTSISGDLGVSAGNFSVSGTATVGSSVTTNSLIFSTDVSQTILNYYAKSSVSCTITYEDGTTSPITIKFVRIGNFVSCIIPTIDKVLGTVSSSFKLISGVPAAFNPSIGSTQYNLVYGLNIYSLANHFVTMPATVLNNNTIRIYSNMDLSNLPDSAETAIDQCIITWQIAN